MPVASGEPLVRGWGDAAEAAVWLSPLMGRVSIFI